MRRLREQRMALPPGSEHFNNVGLRGIWVNHTDIRFTVEFFTGHRSPFPGLRCSRDHRKGRSTLRHFALCFLVRIRVAMITNGAVVTDLASRYVRWQFQFSLNQAAQFVGRSHLTFHRNVRE